MMSLGTSSGGSVEVIVSSQLHAILHTQTVTLLIHIILLVGRRDSLA